MTEIKHAEYLGYHDLILEDNSDPMICIVGELPNGQMIASNMVLRDFVKNPNANWNFFLVDHSEFSNCLDENKDNKEEFDKIITSFAFFSKSFKSAFYIRKMPEHVCGYGQIFADDVIMLVSALLEQQKLKADAGAMNFLNLFWKMDGDRFKTMPEEALVRILDELKIDKSGITIVPDMFFVLSLERILEYGETPAKTMSPDGRHVTSPVHAAFHVFKTLGCRKICEKCRTTFEKLAIETLEKFRKMNKSLFITLDHVNRLLQVLQNILCAICQAPPPDPFLGKKYEDVIRFSEYQKICAKMSHPTYPNFLKKDLKRTGDIPVWMAKLYIVGGWFQTSFIKENYEIKDFLKHVIIYLVPGDLIMDTEFNLFLTHVIECHDRPWPMARFAEKVLNSAVKRREFFKRQKQVFRKKNGKKPQKKKPEQPDNLKAQRAIVEKRMGIAINAVLRDLTRKEMEKNAVNHLVCQFNNMAFSSSDQ